MAASRGCVALLALAIAVGCAAPNPAPPGWSPTPKQAQTRVLGHWVIVEVFSGERYSGELIAVGRAGEGAEAIYLGAEHEILAIPLVRVRRLRLVEHARDGSGLILWAQGGTLATLSHGYFLIITAPIWMLTGMLPAAFSAHSGAETHRRRAAAAARVRKYARFPQGLPSGWTAEIREVRPR